VRRRDFLKTGALTWAGLSAGVASARDSDREQRPVVISTWDFGLAANRVAVETLAGGASVLDAVERGVMTAENDPEVTSVGYGGMPNINGVVELDAAIMDGGSMEAGSVAALRGIKNPIAVARKVMTETRHLMLVGAGAQRFALQQGFKKEKLLTPKAKKRWQELKSERAPRSPVDDHDTLGMVALDARGEMAAACTTSGHALKLPGRVGDSPLIGDGLYCDSTAGGAAATGDGEEVIKVCGSYQVVEFMRQGLEPDEAIRRVLERILRRDAANRDGFVGFVALRRDGALGFGSTTPGFQAAVSRGDQHERIQSPSLIPPK